MEKFNAIILDSDIGSRMRLKQATSAVHQFGKVYQINSLREGIDKLNSNERCDVVFISGQLSKDEVKGFIEGGKQTTGGQDAAYILVLKAKDQESSSVAEIVLVGADGLLFEPYSVDYLLEITQLADRVKSERSCARQLAATKFLLTDVMNQLDQIAYNKASGAEVGQSWKKFKDAAEVLNTFKDEQLKLYYDLAVQMFVDSPVPKRNFQRLKYVGASKRMQARAAKKAAAKSASEQAAGKPSIPDSPSESSETASTTTEAASKPA